MLDSFRILIPSLGRVAKEGGVSHAMCFLPMPVSRVPLEVSNETRLKDPEDVGFFTWSREVFGDPESCSVELLGEHSHRFVARQGDGNAMRVGRLNTACGGSLSVFPNAG